MDLLGSRETRGLVRGSLWGSILLNNEFAVFPFDFDADRANYETLGLSDFE